VFGEKQEAISLPSDYSVRLEELESRIAMCITDEHVFVMNQHRYLLGQPEGTPQTPRKNRKVVHGGVLALKSDVFSGSEKPGLYLHDMK
jgi:hypothetical protein